MYQWCNLCASWPRRQPINRIAIARSEAVRSEIEKAAKVNLVSLTKDATADDAATNQLLFKPLAASTSSDNVNDDANAIKQSTTTSSSSSSEAQLSSVLSP